ncbi:hypothetical protein F4824DRAFT_490865 [Ustulina deusta]|nr:hypothetical protein F4824DRAFT_490865 [Ustulina deusta]
MLPFLFVLLIISISGIDIAASGTIDFGLEIGSTSCTATSTITSLNPSRAPSDAGDLSTSTIMTTKTSTQTVTKTISQIMLVTVTAPYCTALSGATTIVTSRTGWLGTASRHSTRNSMVSLKTSTPLRTSPTHSTRSSTIPFKMGTPPTISPTISLRSGGNAMVQQAWSLFVVMAIALGFSCLQVVFSALLAVSFFISR